MTLALWLELINGILQFPSASLSLIRMLKKTPVENHEALVLKIEAEQENFIKTGRPS